jgi:hypothetical protein
LLLAIVAAFALVALEPPERMKKWLDFLGFPLILSGRS